MASPLLLPSVRRPSALPRGVFTRLQPPHPPRQCARAARQWCCDAGRQTARHSGDARHSHGAGTPCRSTESLGSVNAPLEFATTAARVSTGLVSRRVAVQVATAMTIWKLIPLVVMGWSRVLSTQKL